MTTSGASKNNEAANAVSIPPHSGQHARSFPGTPQRRIGQQPAGFHDLVTRLSSAEQLGEPPPNERTSAAFLHEETTSGAFKQTKAAHAGVHPVAQRTADTPHL